MEVVTMPNGHTPEEAIWDALTIYGAGTLSYSRWEFSESIVPLAFLGAVQVEVDTTTLPSEPKTPKSARFNTRGDINKNNQRRKKIIADGNGIDRNYSSAKEYCKKKKEDLMRLQSDEQAMEQHHRMLSSCVEDLKEEV
ncbi:hypothetical protein DER44DRAFT_761530 [Fusarium oxysporum]|nr:hypothetical protein DER44DRAFT_761530 [Fusarium oxysporum]